MREVQNVAQEMHGDWKQAEVNAAHEAIMDGLQCKDDPYKRMDGGIKVMAGRGVYKSGDSVTVNNIALNLHDMPANWRDQFFFDDDDVRDIEARQTQD